MQPYVPRFVLDELAHRRLLKARKTTTWPAIVHLTAAARRSLGIRLIRAGRRPRRTHH